MRYGRIRQTDGAEHLTTITGTVMPATETADALFTLLQGTTAVRTDSLFTHDHIL